MSKQKVLNRITCETVTYRRELLLDEALLNEVVEILQKCAVNQLPQITFQDIEYCFEHKHTPVLDTEIEWKNDRYLISFNQFIKEETYTNTINDMMYELIEEMVWETEPKFLDSDVTDVEDYVDEYEQIF